MSASSPVGSQKPVRLPWRDSQGDDATTRKEAISRHLRGIKGDLLVMLPGYAIYERAKQGYEQYGVTGAIGRGIVEGVTYTPVYMGLGLIGLVRDSVDLAAHSAAALIGK